MVQRAVWPPDDKHTISSLLIFLIYWLYFPWFSSTAMTVLFMVNEDINFQLCCNIGTTLWAINIRISFLLPCLIDVIHARLRSYICHPGLSCTLHHIQYNDHYWMLLMWCIILAYSCLFFFFFFTAETWSGRSGSINMHFPAFLCAVYGLSVNSTTHKYLEHCGAVQPQRATCCTLIGAFYGSIATIAW